MKIFRVLFSLLLTGTILLFGIKPALAFCGFYVAKADSSLYNQASQVIIARDGRRTVLTMSNDYQGEVKDFAMVVPVPVAITKEQVKIADPKIIDRIDAFSAPRLVEYFDRDPCYRPRASFGSSGRRGRRRISQYTESDTALGVTVEEKFSVGEYDILILSAKESDGLATWLNDNGYQLPQDAEELLQPYIRQRMKFFVAKVNLEEFDSRGFEKLRPISIAYRSSKFMLPIRLGMTNAENEQDLIVYLLSSEGRTELTNYRTVEIPSRKEIPAFVENEFADFYQATFETVYENEDKQVAVLEYAWDMGSCDPCAADPLSQEELKQAGVFWLDNKDDVYITRLHIRYTRKKFPEDLKFQFTSNTRNFQGRYIIRRPYEGETTCDDDDLKRYQERLVRRRERQAETLAELTKWDLNEIREEMAKN